MRNKLQKFTDFAHGLLPHETAYLLSVQQFQDAKKVEILRQIDHNCQNIHQFKPFDESIDKRKYSNLKSWIEERLAEIDVDAQYEWMARTHQRVMTDAIGADEEKQLLKVIKEPPLSMAFYFVKFYELVQDYRQYLLIRMRYNEHRTTDDFLKKNRDRYDYCRAVSEKMHDATLDIVQQYTNGEADSIGWEEWLTARFFDEALDGLNRYFALVRLGFIYYNYGRFENLRDKYDHMDALFKKGLYYSKRLLVNYYGNRLLLHTRFREFDRAEYYGYLSIRVKTSDYLFYVNNLAAILLREKKTEAALKLMRQAQPETKRTQSFHNRVGFVAFYAKCLNANQLCKNAESYIESFLRVYKSEVFEQRWHLFFTSYVEALLGQRKYGKTLQIIRRYKLLEKEKQYRKNTDHLPTLYLYNALAEFKEDRLLLKELSKIVAQERAAFANNTHRAQQLQNIILFLGEHMTEGERARL